jgi:hypothetical protein
MSAIAPALLQKIESLPQQRVAEVEDFVEFLMIRESRTAAGTRLGSALAKLDARNQLPLSDDEIAAEIAAARNARRT